MTPDEFKEMRQQLGYTQVGLADYLGVTDRAVRRWEAGDRKIDPPAAVALELMVRLANYQYL